MSRKKLTKPLSVSFFPAYSDDIFGPQDAMYPGSFDGAKGGTDPAGNKEFEKKEGKSGGALLWGAAFLYNETGTGELRCGGIAIKKVSQYAPAHVYRSSGTPYATRLTRVGESASVSQSYYCDRIALYSSYPNSSQYSERAVECAWGQHSDESGSGYHVRNGFNYESGSTGDLEQVAAGARFGNNMRYKRVTSGGGGYPDLPILAAGGFAGTGSCFLELAIGTRGDNSEEYVTSKFSWQAFNMADEMSTSPDALFTDYTGQDMAWCERWQGGGFDVNTSGQWAVAWSKWINDIGFVLCIATGTMDSNNGGSINSNVMQPAKIWFPYDADMVAAPPVGSSSYQQYPAAYRDGNVCCVFLNPTGDWHYHQNFGVRHPQVVVTDDGYIFLRAGTKDKAGWDKGLFGYHEFTTDHTDLEKGWTWFSDGWSDDFGLEDPSPGDSSGNTAFFVTGHSSVNNGYPVLLSATGGAPSSTYSVDTDFFREFGNQGGKWWSISSMHIGRVMDETYPTQTHEYFAATGQLMVPGSSRPVSEVACLYCQSLNIYDPSDIHSARVVEIWPGSTS